jgi:hypothetical protein
MAASFNAGFHGDSSELNNCTLCIDKYPAPSNGHHQIGMVGANNQHHQLTLPRFNNNNAFYGNGSSCLGVLGSISPENDDGGGLLADLLQTLSSSTLASSPSPPIISDLR